MLGHLLQLNLLALHKALLLVELGLAILNHLVEHLFLLTAEGVHLLAVVLGGVVQGGVVGGHLAAAATGVLRI